MTSRAKPACKVLYVTHDSTLMGASRSLLDILSMLDMGRIQPTVLLRKHGPLEQKLCELGVETIKIPYGLAVRKQKHIAKDALKAVVNPNAVRRVAAILKDDGFDLVHCNSILQDIGMIAAKRAQLPYVVHVRELVTEDHDLVFCNEVRMKQLMRSAAMNIYISGFVEKKFSDWAGNAPKMVLRDAIESAGYVKEHQPLFEGGEVSLLLAGRITPGKGQLEAIRATEHLKSAGVDVTLTIAGGIADKGYYAECAEYVANKNMDNVRLLDFVDDLSELRAKSDISLTCSRSEALGRVTVEGMMSGCLAIGAKAGGTVDLIEDGNTGLLYEQGSPDDLAEKIAWALNNPEEARRIASTGQNWTTHSFDSKSYVERLQVLYDEILGRLM